MTALASEPRQGIRARKRVPRLDGIRGFCAMTVVITHVAFATTAVLGSAAGAPKDGFWSILAAGQTLTIGPFFIMSGLLLYRPFAKATIMGTPRPALFPFFVRRATRILPAFWGVVAFCLLVLNFDVLHSTWDVLRPLLLLQIYDFHFYAGLDVTWTAPAESQFYLALPILAGVMHLLAKTTNDPVKKSQRMLIPVALLIISELSWTAYIHNGSLGQWPSEFFWPLEVTGLWGIGMAMAVWSIRAEVAPARQPAFYAWAVRRPNWFWVAALVLYGINCLQPFAHWGTADWLSSRAAVTRDLITLGFSFLVMVPLTVPNASSKFMEGMLSNRPMRFLGRISYGIYLWHFAILYLVFRSGSIFGHPPTPVNFLLGKYGFWHLVVPVTVGAIVAATLSFYLIERPIAQLGERLVVSFKDRALRSGTTANPGSFDPDERRTATL
jgi:peptidoglycan/LPS O-acetylase OafA/YrhL